MIGRGIRRILTSVVFLVVIGFVLAYLVLRASLPDLDGEHVVTGIDARVLIERDAAGIPTITADSRADLAFATGYAHGQDAGDALANRPWWEVFDDPDLIELINIALLENNE